jgi:hypothetical protein
MEIPKVEPKTEDAEPKKTEENRYEGAFGVTLAVFAAALALNELGSGKYGDDELRMATEKANAYLWYQSKGIKESLADGQRDLLHSLVEGEFLGGAAVTKMKAQTDKLEKDVKRYKLEKREILLGSKKVGREGWVQDIDGELGKVVGVKEMESQLVVLGNAGDRFDLATLFLQITLVFGAIGLLMKQPQRRRAFLILMIVLGLVGASFSGSAFYMVSRL